MIDLWQRPRRAQPASAFTTIGNWRQPWRDVTFEGETYSWSKHHEFLKFIDLPSRTGQPFELALSSYEDGGPADARGARAGACAHALDFSTDTDAYRDYIAGSRGEFTVAKDQNVRLRTGWFSDRSATYLAAGRPVISQDTGFSNVLPTGEGLFGFSTMEEIVEAASSGSTPTTSATAARATEIAREYFSHDVVLARCWPRSAWSCPARGGRLRAGAAPSLSRRHGARRRSRAARPRFRRRPSRRCSSARSRRSGAAVAGARRRRASWSSRYDNLVFTRLAWRACSANTRPCPTTS